MRKLLLAPFALSLGLAACAYRVEPLSQAEQRVQREGDRVPDQVGDPSDPANDPTDPSDDPTDPTLIGPDPSDPDPGDLLPAWDSSMPFQSVNGGRFAGSMGAVTNFDLAMDQAYVFDDGYYTEVEVLALRADGERVMLLLQSQNAVGEPFFKPGVGMRFTPGYLNQGGEQLFIGALACHGPDSGVQAMGMAFADTPFDEEPCDVGVDTEQDPENPGALNVSVQATFPDENGDCPDVDGDDDGDGDADLPDGDGDGDGDLPVDGEPGDGSLPGDGGGDGAYPLSATATFQMVQ